jgi:hypothetical protein
LEVRRLRRILLTLAAALAAAALSAPLASAGAPTSSGIDDPSSWGEWIADVERPAAQYRGRYQLRLPEARSLLGEGTGRRQNGRAGGGPEGAGRACRGRGTSERRIAGEDPRVSDDEIDLAAEVLDSSLAALQAAAPR